MSKVKRPDFGNVLKIGETFSSGVEGLLYAAGAQISA
jgi:hypothetical protein